MKGFREAAHRYENLLPEDFMSNEERAAEARQDRIDRVLAAEDSRARESVEDALLIVESYGPWGADLNDAYRRQIVLADEVIRLRSLYEMAVHGRSEMRAALRKVAEWQPIETVPRDGTEVLLRSRKGRHADGCYVQVNAAHGYWAWSLVCDEPTHWMPLPPAPEER